MPVYDSGPLLKEKSSKTHFLVGSVVFCLVFSGVEACHVEMTAKVLLCGLAVFLLRQSALAESRFSFLTNGLVAYYPLDGDASDRSVNHDDGRTFGVLPTLDRFGKTGALYFNRTNQSGIRIQGTNLPVGGSPRTVSLYARFWPRLN